MIDDGRSFQHTAEALSGAFIAFGKDPACLNPFAMIDAGTAKHDGDYREECFAMLAGVIGRMCRRRGSIDDIEAALISEAIAQAWDKAGNGADLGSVREHLRNRDDRRAKDMATALGPWCPGGSMGRLFGGSQTPALDRALTVFELAELKGRGDLQAVVLMLVVFLATQRMRSEQVATVNLPSFRAGCGGIDGFAGAFSFINSDQLIAFARAVAQNAAGFAFELALETISPVIAETMSKLRALAQWVNGQNLNSCETAQALVGALWSKNDRASSAICAAIGTSQGIFSDYAAARHGCGADGKRNSTLASATGPMADQLPVNVNYAWKAIRASSFLSGDTQLAEFRHGGDRHADRHRPHLGRRQFRPPGAHPGAAGARPAGDGSADGGRRQPAGLCLRHRHALPQSTLGSVSIPADRGFRARVAELLRDLVDAVRRDVAPPAAALGLVNLTTLPVYRVANAAAAYRGAVVDQEMDALAEAVALDVMQVWLVCRRA